MQKPEESRLRSESRESKEWPREFGCEQEQRQKRSGEKRVGEYACGTWGKINQEKINKGSWSWILLLWVCRHQTLEKVAVQFSTEPVAALREPGDLVVIHREVKTDEPMCWVLLLQKQVRIALNLIRKWSFITNIMGVLPQPEPQ